MNDEDALLRAICEQPAEDTPRLVFADYLQECGDNVNSAWAKLIRSQIALAAGATDNVAVDERHVRLFQSQFWKARVAERLGVTPGRAGLDGWERGFPTRLDGDFTAVRALWPGVINRVPLRTLYLTSVDDDAIDEFVSWPGLARLTSLRMETPPLPVPFGITPYGSTPRRLIGERGVSALAACPGLAGLESLFLGYFAITEAVVDAILNSPHLTGLRELRLRRNGPFDPVVPDELRDRIAERFDRYAAL